MKSLLVNYTRYNIWANDRILNFIKDNVSEEQLDTEIISSFSSLRKTLYHIWDAEDVWLMRLNGDSGAFGVSKRFKGSLPEVYAAILDNSKKFAAHVESKDESYFLETLHYQNIKGTPFDNKIQDMVQHCMNHSSYHRGQIITMLRQLGFATLFETDYIAYCRLGA